MRRRELVPALAALGLRRDDDDSARDHLVEQLAEQGVVGPARLRFTTFGFRSIATSSARASEKLEHCAATLSRVTAQQARSDAIVTSGATPTIPSRLFAADAMIPAIAVPCTSPPRGAGPASTKLRATLTRPCKSGCDAVDRRVDDRDRHASPRCEPMSVRDVHLRRARLQIGVRIVVAETACVSNSSCAARARLDCRL